MAHIFVSILQRIQFLMDSFHIWQKWSLVWEAMSCAITVYLGVCPHYNSAMTVQQKPLKYRTPCPVRYVTSAVLNGLLTYVSQTITSMRCVGHNDFDIDLYLWGHLAITKYTAKILLILLCPICNIRCSGWTIFMFGTMIRSMRGCWHVMMFCLVGVYLECRCLN